MPAPADLGNLNTKDFDNLQDLADSLEKAWTQGQSVDLTRFLPPAGAPNRAIYLQELIKTDLGCRWRNGQPVGLDYYLEKFAQELGPAQSIAPALVFEEYRVRQLYGDHPLLDQFHSRFPQQFAEVQRLAKQHDWVKDSGRLSASQPSSHSTGILAKNVVLAQTGGYALLERIGAGAFGEVWKAQAPGGITKAVKIIIRPFDEEEAQSEIRAMELIKNLRHKYLLNIDSFWQLEDRLIILMPLADGSLRDRLNQCRKQGLPGIPLPDLMKQFRQTAEALDFLHKENVQHRDIKPANILLVDNDVRVADFGVARALGTRRMVSGTFGGTLPYMPPEALAQKTHVHGDQYSLAATYFELRVGRVLFKDYEAIVSKPPQMEPLPQAEQDVLSKALAKDPEQRFPTCVAFVEALERAVAPELPVLVSEDTGSQVLETQINTILPSGGVKPSWSRPDTHPEVDLGQASYVPSPPSWLKRAAMLLPLLALAVVVGIILWPKPPPPGPAVWLPESNAARAFRPKEGSEILTLAGKKYYQRIECVVAGLENQPVEFVLIPWDEPPHQPFYIMVDKVWNSLFEKFADQHPEALAWSRWRLGARLESGNKEEDNQKDPFFVRFQPEDPFPFFAALGSEPRAASLTYAMFTDFPFWFPHPADLGTKNGRHPVLRVDIVEANECAQWLSGMLPSVDEWDKAAGRYEKDHAAYKDWDEGEIAMKDRQAGDVATGQGNVGPVEVGDAKKDRSRLGCNHMAGNGREWTRTYYRGDDFLQGEFVGGDLTKLDGAQVFLRGRHFMHPDPLKIEDLVSRPEYMPFFEKERKEPTRTMLPQLGFRVVIPLKP